MTDNDEYTFYIFACNDPNITDCYVGSTKAFRQRKTNHKYQCNNEKNKSYNVKIYQTIRVNGGWDNWEMKPIDVKHCSKLEARIHETKLMEERNSTLNMCNAYVNKKEYDKEWEKTDKRKEYKKQYNKEYEKTDKRKAYHKEYRLKKKTEQNAINQHTSEVQTNYLLLAPSSQEHCPITLPLYVTQQMP